MENRIVHIQGPARVLLLFGTDRGARGRASGLTWDSPASMFAQENPYRLPSHEIKRLHPQPNIHTFRLLVAGTDDESSTEAGNSVQLRGCRLCPSPGF